MSVGGDDPIGRGRHLSRKKGLSNWSGHRPFSEPPASFYPNISKKAENIQLKSKERSITAMKFVKFESDANEDFQGKGFKRGSSVSLVRVSI